MKYKLFFQITFLLLFSTVVYAGMIEYEYDELNRLKKITPVEYTLFINDIKLMMSTNQLIKANEPESLTLSGITVTDSILQYISDNDVTQYTTQIKKRQDNLYQAYNDDNSNPEMSMQLMKKILNNEKSNNYYNFGTTEDALSHGVSYTDQNEVNKLMCHWMDYEVYGASKCKENVPVAVATESYNQWMLAVGFATDRDPYKYPWDIPKDLGFNGIFVIIPFSRGNPYEDPEFVHYIQSTQWNKNYFKPVYDKIIGKKIYAAVLEPPETDTDYEMAPKISEQDTMANEYLNQKIYAYSYTQPWDSIDAYNERLHQLLLKNPDYQKSLKRAEFKEAMNHTKVTRMLKVERDDQSYAIIPYDREKNNKLVTPMIIVMSLDGKFESVTVNNDSEKYFKLTDRWDAFVAVWFQLDHSKRYIINNWAANEKNFPLSPVYNTVTYGQIKNEEKNMTYYNTEVVTLKHDHTLITKNISPAIEPIGSYPKGNTSYETTWKTCEEYLTHYQGDPIMYNLILDYSKKYQKLFEDSIYATGYKFKVSDPDGTVKDVYSQNSSKQLYDIVKIEDDIYELSVPKDGTASSVTITAVDNDAVCVAFDDETQKCKEYSRYGGGYSFYPFQTDTENL